MTITRNENTKKFFSEQFKVYSDIPVEYVIKVSNKEDGKTIQFNKKIRLNRLRFCKLTKTYEWN